MKSSRRLLLLGLLLLLLACATVVAPSGGPEDKLAPRVAAVYPMPNATNMPTELLVRLEFDEWIQSSLPRNAVVISPPLEKKLKLKVSGDVLEISSNAVLDSNTTYTLTLGNALKDLRGNAIAPPFQLAFSTGNHIDSLSLSGKILLTQEMVAAKELPSIGLYPLGTERSKRNYLKKYRDSLLNAPDTVPFLTKEIPLFFTQADSNGFFKVIGLSPGKYRIVAFVDANGNRRLDQTTEPGGIYGDISLDSLFKDSLWLPLGNLDTSGVVLDSVKQLGATIIQPIFNAAVNPDSLKGCMLYGSNKKVLDSLQKILAPNGKPAFAISVVPVKDSSYVFKCAFAKDSLGRYLDTLQNEFEFIWREFPNDTFPANLATVIPRSGQKLVFPEKPVLLTYDKVVYGDTLEKDLFFIVRKDTLPVKVIRKDAANFEVQSLTLLPYDAKISLQQRYLDSTLALPDSTGKRDTIVETKYKVLASFETAPKLRVATLQGKISTTQGKIKIRLRSVETGEIKDTLSLEDGSFKMESLLDGKYLLDYFYPDSNGCLDVGSLEPLRFAKPWRTPLDTLVLQPGENVLEQLITLPKLP